ncbi:hypothetical protein [Criibacterium bergeronii]|uniref:hypothetical protein n=1 Tax=Criibacterium bergeronii TaxID=1871336 RepID=UPI001FAB30AB|nr:hypothetical protein [Criibacterium bergeronii]
MTSIFISLGSIIVGLLMLIIPLLLLVIVLKIYKSKNYEKKDLELRVQLLEKEIEDIKAHINYVDEL